MGANAPRRLPPLLLLLLPLLLPLLLLLLLLACLCVLFWFVGFVAGDTLAKQLRCRPAKPMEPPRLGSNPAGVV